MPVTRREFMLGAAAAGLAVAGTNALEPLAHAAKSRPLPAPAQSGIEHIVVMWRTDPSTTISAGSAAHPARRPV